MFCYLYMVGDKREIALHIADSRGQKGGCPIPYRQLGTEGRLFCYLYMVGDKREIALHIADSRGQKGDCCTPCRQ